MAIGSITRTVSTVAAEAVDELTETRTEDAVATDGSSSCFIPASLPKLAREFLDVIAVTSAGPSGEINYGDQQYLVNDGRVSLNGKDIGTCDDDGNYRVKLDGQEVTGNVVELVGANYRGILSDGAKVSNRPIDGMVELGNDTFKVSQGRVSKDGQIIGTIEDNGEFNVKLDGQTVQGRLSDVPGAIFHGHTHDGTEVDNRPDGEIHLGTKDFTVKDGRVFLDGLRVGTIADDGRYKVLLDGKHQTGNIDDVHGVTYRGVKGSNGEEVWASGPSGNMNAALLGLPSLAYGRFGDFRHMATEPCGHVEAYGGEIYHQGVGADGKGFSVRIGTVNTDNEFVITVDGRTYSGVYGGGYLMF